MYSFTQLKREADTRDEEGTAADHHTVQNAAGRQAKQRKSAAFIEKLHI